MDFMEELIQTLFPDGTVNMGDTITVSNLALEVIPLNCDILMYVTWGNHEREFYLVETLTHAFYIRISLIENNENLKYAFIHSTIAKSDENYLSFIQEKTDSIQLAIDMKNAGQIRGQQ
jgi:hypothetical protein